MKITVVVENTVAFPFEPGIRPGLYGEHGLALMIAHSTGTWLYDTGRGKALLPNLETLGVSPDVFCGIVLSHAHLDHFGGLAAFLKKRSKPIDLYIHPQAFSTRYTRIGSDFREVGLPWTADQLAELGAKVHFVTEAQCIADGIWATGGIARRHSFEKHTENFYMDGPNGEKIRDEILDDQALLLETDCGIVVLTGCAHAGICNILDAAKEIFPDKKIHAVLGGLHLVGATEEQMQNTLAYFQKEQMDVVAVGHCTGFPACRIFSEELAEAFALLHTGKCFSFAPA